MDANQAGKKIRAYFGAITERGMEPREIMIDMEDFLKWVERLGCLEKDMDGMIERLLAGKGHMTYRVLLSGGGRRRAAEGGVTGISGPLSRFFRDSLSRFLSEPHQMRAEEHFQALPNASRTFSARQRTVLRIVSAASHLPSAARLRLGGYAEHETVGASSAFRRLAVARRRHPFGA